MAYTPTNWTNFPSTATPVNASNLNKIENELVALDTDKADATALDDKVDKVAGKGLSTEDFTTEEKTKLAGISAEANKVEITPVVTEGTTLATISIDGVDTDIKGSDIDVDDEMSPTSENPVQNKVIYNTLQSILPEETAEGNPISISDASGLSAKSCEVTFSPIQSGSGDPSPENVRPISGRDSVVLNQCGKNLFDEEHATIYNGSLAGGTWVGAQANARSYAFDVSIFLNTPVTISFDNNIVLKRICTVDTLPSNPTGSYNITCKQFVDNISNPYTFTPTHRYIVVQLTNTYINNRSSKLQIELGSTATPYTAYNPTTHIATFPDTVYGGEYEFVSGKVKSEWGYIASYNGETITEPWISDRDVYVAGTTPSTGAEVCYKLANPQEITITPETIALLKGNNTLWTDGDNITLKYSADIKAYIDSQLNS